MVALAFAGAATPLATGDIAATAQLLGCDVAVVEAVQTVESGASGGFLPDKRPEILFEAEHFSELTAHRYDKAYPTISSPIWNPKLYLGGAAEYGRLATAIGLNRTAALQSASWGSFQIMGFNFAAAGYADVESFVVGMAASARNQLIAFARFCVSIGTDADLKSHNWTAFAKAYNGVGYAVNGYDTKLAAAYARNLAASNAPPASADPVVGLLCMGMVSPAVGDVQRALTAFGYPLNDDDVFGRGTELAVYAFQTANHLGADGIVGTETLAALGLPPSP